MSAGEAQAPPPEPVALLETAVAAARAAGEHAAANRHRRTESILLERHDVKLVLDVECQARAEACIRARYPQHDILGEEDGSNRPDAPALKETALCPQSRGRILWVIDPIDGTVNFSHGMREWCCSVAVVRDDVILAGCVYAPEMGELYTAYQGGPAACNGTPIGVSAVADLGRSVVTTGLDKKRHPDGPPAPFFHAILAQVQRARVMGAAAYDMCRVAAGRADAYFESGIYLWDIAAAALIVNAAGGRTELLAHLPGGRLEFLASNGRIHDALRAVVKGVPHA